MTPGISGKFQRLIHASVPMPRIKLVLEYDGTHYVGWQLQPNGPSIQGRLMRALAELLGGPVDVFAAGRTDAGVHARGQVVTFDVADEAIEDLSRRDRRGRPGTVRLRDAVNGLVGPAVVVAAATVVDGTFDARFSATGRTYRYTVLSSAGPDPFLAGRVWWVDQPLDVDAMNRAAAHLVGEHDFSSFCRRPKPASEDTPAVSLVRRVTDAVWTTVDEGTDPLGAGGAAGTGEPDRRVLRFTISATAFCHQMVRSITGLLVDVGRGRRFHDDVAEVLAARDRSAAGQIAPPHGLTLWSVDY